MCLLMCFFKQKTAYELRISDWSSDVCSSDLPFAPRSFSLIAIHKYGIPFAFPEEVEEEAARVAALPLHPDKREDLRHLPIVAIDPVDARDFDDAVWAAPDESGDNSGDRKSVV